jgi:heme A synthase
VIRTALLALLLGLLLTVSVVAGVRDVPLLSRVLLALGMFCLAGSVAAAVWSRPRSEGRRGPRR